RAMAVPQQHAHVVGAGVGGDDNGDTVAVVVQHVQHGQGSRHTPHGEGVRRLESAITVAQQHTHGVVRVEHAAAVGGDQVGSAVAIDVGQSHRGWIFPHGEGPRRLKSAVAVAQQHTEVFRLVVGSNQVVQAIAVDVS